MAKPKIIFVLGGPGAGKGTQCAKIQEAFGFQHISAGDCLREAQLKNSAESDLIRNYISEGLIVPVEITCSLLRQKMQELGWDKHKYLIDGFPRNANNLDGWQKTMDDVDVLFCLHLDCPNDVMIQRILSRSKHSGRIDDNVKTITNRLKVYQDDTVPIIEQFKKEAKYKKVNGSASINSVWAEISEIFSKELKE